jgi:hypothetical protein
VLSFRKSQAVVASFQGGVERSVTDADAFGESLIELRWLLRGQVLGL